MFSLCYPCSTYALMYFVSISRTMETFCHFVTKSGSKYGEMMRCLSILVLSLNCQKGSLLLLVLANSVIKMDVPKLQDPLTKQGCPDTKIELSGHNFQQLSFLHAVVVWTWNKVVRTWLLCCLDTLSATCQTPILELVFRHTLPLSRHHTLDIVFKHVLMSLGLEFLYMI